jgi:hypothetical protein
VEPSPEYDVTRQNVGVPGNNSTNMLGLTRQTDYWATMDSFTPFYKNMMKQDLFTHPLTLPLQKQQE